MGIEPNTITITFTWNIKKSYYYYYYFPDYYYYFPITIAFIFTVEPQKQETSRLQRNNSKTFITSMVSNTVTCALSQ